MFNLEMVELVKVFKTHDRHEFVLPHDKHTLFTVWTQKHQNLHESRIFGEWTWMSMNVCEEINICMHLIQRRYYKCFQLETFVLQLLHHKAEFSVFGLFPLHSPILTSVGISNKSTHLVYHVGGFGGLLPVTVVKLCIQFIYL